MFNTDADRLNSTSNPKYQKKFVGFAWLYTLFWYFQGKQPEIRKGQRPKI